MLGPTFRTFLMVRVEVRVISGSGVAINMSTVAHTQTSNGRVKIFNTQLSVILPLFKIIVVGINILMVAYRCNTHLGNMLIN